MMILTSKHKCIMYVSISVQKAYLMEVASRCESENGE